MGNVLSVLASADETDGQLSVVFGHARQGSAPPPHLQKHEHELIYMLEGQMFGSQGPSAVTLRSIATVATVNVAAVNYHFGSKENLFEEIFRRRVIPLNAGRLARLKACQEASGGAPKLKDVVTAFVLPALQLIGSVDENARSIVVQYSLGRLLAIPSANESLASYYNEVRVAFVDAIQRAAPTLAPHEVVWKYYWMGGSVMYALAIPPDSVQSCESVGAALLTNTAAMTESLIGFVVQGILAGSGCPAPPKRRHRG